VTHRYVQDDVHDFAWTADKRSATPLEGVWTGPGSPAVKVKVIYPPEYASNAAPALQAARDSLTYFSKTLGPYPYRTLTVVIPPFNAGEAGGMEYPTFITAESYKDVSPNTVERYLLDFVTIHEFGHGYFYGILASNEFEEPMLDEGMNDYWDLRMVRERRQQIHVGGPVSRALGVSAVFDPFELERLGAPRESPADAPGQNAWDRLQGLGPVYVRTATTMRDLEARVGKDAIERGFREYYWRWKFRHPSTADLRETLAEVTGQRAAVEQVFAQQLYRVDKVDDRIAELASREELPQPGSFESGGNWVEQTDKALREHIGKTRDDWKKIHPKAKEGTGPFPFRTTVTLRRYGAPVPQTLVVRFADGSSETVRWDEDEKWRQFSWVKPAKAVSAELDPQRIHYLDASKLDDSRTLEADRSASTRWASDFAAFVQLLLSLIATV
jgi:hypothetical protein